MLRNGEDTKSSSFSLLRSGSGVGSWQQDPLEQDPLEQTPSRKNKEFKRISKLHSESRRINNREQGVKTGYLLLLLLLLWCV